MIDFNNLELIVNDKYSFVGIQKRNTKLQFCLPKGFSDKLENLQSFDAKCKLFFLFYQILEEFKHICIDKGYLADNFRLSTSDRDGVIQNNQGSKVSISDQEEENIFYSKLDTITNILKAYDEPKILSLVYRLGRSENIDYSQFHKFLHHAIFLPNGAAYIDYMNLPRQQIQFDSTDIVAMYCYILWEIKQQLNQEISEEIKALGQKFRQCYIGSEYGLFQDNFYSQIIEILKDALELIDRNTPLKDTDYWQLYEVIELFLYGEINHNEDGEIWGIKNFNNVWESMCLTYLAKNTPHSFLLYLDTQFISAEIINKWQESSKIIDFSNIFQFNGSQLRPDAMIFSSSFNDFLDAMIFASSFDFFSDKEYKVCEDSWNDYGYRTAVKLMNLKVLKIAYIGQPENHHTLNELSKFYRTKNGFYLINKPLPANYYSYWKIKDQDIEAITQAYYFNHIFYLSVKKGIFSYKDFNSIEDILLSVCDHEDNNNSSDKFDVFTISLLRDQKIETIANEFASFIELLFDFCHSYFNLIDIKYLPESYFLNSDNIEDIKYRSIRKQFLYEYLVQKNLDYSQSKLKKLNIISDFWLPNCGQTNLIENGKQFMDKYIGLKTIDFINLAENYCSQDFSSIQNQFQTHKEIYLSVGDRVFHRSFGVGEVTNILGSGKKSTIRIKFAGLGYKIIDPKVAPMERIEG